VSDGVHNSRSQFDEMGRAAEEGLRHGSLAGQPQSPDFALSMITSLHYGSKPVQDALERIDELAETHPHPAFILQQAVFHAMKDDVETARTLAAIGEARFHELSDGPFATLMRAEIEELAGNLEGASELLGVACERFAQRGQATGVATYAPLRGLALCALDRHDEAERLAEQGRALAHKDDHLSQSLWRRVSALVHAERDELAEGERLAREAVAEARESDSPQMQAAALADLAEVLQTADRTAEAAAALRESLELYERKGIVPLVRRTRERLDALEALPGAAELGHGPAEASTSTREG
jgi:hypothetical protein